MRKIRKIIIYALIAVMTFNATMQTRANDVSEESIATVTEEGEFIEDDYNVVFKIVDEWDNHYSANITINNVGVSDIENWELSFEMQGEITSIWDASIVKKEKQGYIVKNNKWNQDIKVGKSVSFGMIVEYDGEIAEPDNFCMTKVCKPVEDEYAIEYKINSKWDNGVTGTIIITNKSDTTIEDWKLSFSSDMDICSMWNADIYEKNESNYYINNADFNSNIAPGDSISVGFSANHYGNVIIDDFILYHMQTFVEDTADSDGDGLSDRYELNVSFTDEKSKDSDNDGMEDGYEVQVLNTNPLLMDSDNNGVNDALEDFDEDLLNNQAEYVNGTEPLNDDSDNDGITDYQEIVLHGTEPLNYDTDDDGLCDGDELSLSLNALISDTDKDGILDSEEKIAQTIVYKENNIEVLRGINIYADVCGKIEDSIMLDVDDYAGESVQGIISSIYGIDNVNSDALRIEFLVNENIQCEIKDIAVLEIFDGIHTLLDAEADETTRTLTISTQKEEAQYCLVNVNEYKTVEAASFSVLDEPTLIRGVSSKERKLRNKLKAQVEKDQGAKMYMRSYSPDEAIDIILSYDKDVTSAANSTGVNKSLIQAILFREITCIYVADDVADIAVANYYAYKQQLENYMKASWVRQLLMGAPTAVYPQREDSSTGLGQIFAKTGINARNYSLAKGEKVYKYSNWKQRRSVWFNLKDDDAYNITMVAKVLRMEAGSGLNAALSSKANTQLLLTRYNNGGTKKIGNYGKICYRYYKLFKNYNK